MRHPTLIRLKAMTNQSSRRLEGREREKALSAALLLKCETEAQLRDIERQILFIESPVPTLRQGWKLPDAPDCDTCKLCMQPAAVFDCGELWLEWSCGVCGDSKCEPNIEWPWTADFVWPIDAAAAGFIVA